MTYLASRGELQWAESDLEVGCVGLEVEERSRNAGLKLRWALARWAVSRDLVHGAHGCGSCRWKGSVDEKEIATTLLGIFVWDSGV